MKSRIMGLGKMGNDLGQNLLTTTIRLSHSIYRLQQLKK